MDVFQIIIRKRFWSFYFCFLVITQIWISILSSDGKAVNYICLTSVASLGEGFLWVSWIGEVTTQLLLFFFFRKHESGCSSDQLVTRFSSQQQVLSYNWLLQCCILLGDFERITKLFSISTSWLLLQVRESSKPGQDGHRGSGLFSWVKPIIFLDFRACISV